jgi:hypothetical protein
VPRFQAQVYAASAWTPSRIGEQMQKPDGNPLPDIDDAQDGGLSSYSAPSATTSLSTAVGDNAPKCAAAAFVLLCFLAFGPRGLALALIVLAALRVTLGPVSGALGSRSGAAGLPPSYCRLLSQYLIDLPAPPLTRWRRRSARQQHSIVQRAAQEQPGRRMRTVRCARTACSMYLAPLRDVAPQKPLLSALNKGTSPQQ